MDSKTCHPAASGSKGKGKPTNWRPVSAEAAHKNGTLGKSQGIPSEPGKCSKHVEPANYTHFISLPLANQLDLVEKLSNFQRSILGDNNDRKNMFEQGDSSGTTELKGKSEFLGVNKGGDNAVTPSELNIDKSIIINPATFHLTVLMLRLWNEDRVAAAVHVLQAVSPKVKDALENRAIDIRLDGLTLLRGTPARAKILYAPVLEVGGEGRLLRACKVITDSFVEAGLVPENDLRRELKLHATVMNTNYRRTQGKKPRQRDDYFDARHILTVHGNNDWGRYRLGEVHLSQRFKYDDNGYYHCCSSIPLPR